MDITNKNNENITDGLIGHRSTGLRGTPYTKWVARQICNSIDRFSKVDIRLIVGHNTSIAQTIRINLRRILYLSEMWAAIEVCVDVCVSEGMHWEHWYTHFKTISHHMFIVRIRCETHLSNDMR